MGPKPLIDYTSNQLCIYVLWSSLVVSTYVELQHCARILKFNQYLVMMLFNTEYSNIKFGSLQTLLQLYLHRISNRLVILMASSFGTKIVQFNSHTFIKSFHWLFHLDYFLSKFGPVSPNSDWFLKSVQIFTIGSKIENGPKLPNLDKDWKNPNNPVWV